MDFVVVFFFNTIFFMEQRMREFLGSLVMGFVLVLLFALGVCGGVGILLRNTLLCAYNAVCSVR